MAEEEKTSIQLKGIAASPGIYIGRALAHNPSFPSSAVRNVPSAQVPRQVRKFEAALKTADAEIRDLQTQLRERLDEAHAAIFDPHLLFVHDPEMKAKIIGRIRERNESAQFAVMAVIYELAEQFRQIEDAYISSRSTDVIDVGHRICKHLQPGQRGSGQPRAAATGAVIVAHDLSPSDTAQMDHRRMRAFATEIGGPTSHTAILAKGLEIPAVVGLGPILCHIGPNATAIVDGYEGTVTINPTEAEIRRAKNRRRRYMVRERDYRKLRDLPAETIDGYRVELSANIELPSEIPHVIDNGANGIGLYRTEFLYLEKMGLPSEDEQFAVYREVIEALAPRAVIFRTLDVGGDKFLAQVTTHQELNPFLGLRAIRFCLANPKIFSTQLRALLRASAFGKAKIMFPMVSSVDQVQQAKAILESAKAELEAEGVAFDPLIEIGIMIEIPAAAIAADRFAREVDFFSIGTNDLIQYTLAIDRSNEKVASLYDPFHPAILRLIQTVIAAAHREGIWVGLCGEMASNPVTALMLVGMGIDELSMSAAAIPEIKYMLRQIRSSEARRLAGEVTSLDSSEEIRAVAEMAYNELKKRRIKEPIKAA